MHRQSTILRNKTKIIATVGPSSCSREILTGMIAAGANVFRLNFSHGTHETHRKIIENIRDIERALSVSVCILQDLQGPKIRVGKLVGDKVKLVLGKELILTSKPVLGNEEMVSVDYPNIIQDIREQQDILMNDGKICLRVLRVDHDKIYTQIIYGGILRSHQGLNLPKTLLSASSFTAKDKADLLFGLSQGVDWVALSFVRTEADIASLRAVATAAGHKEVRVVAKIEKPEAIQNIKSIVDAADGVMVARGDLGVEVPTAEVPIMQKKIVRLCNEYAKPVIIATHMMESMVERNRPTRAETNDVANAVIDGADAVMLSAETAVGSYPVEAVQEMFTIICTTEREAEAIYDKTYTSTEAAKNSLSDALLGVACALVRNTHAKCIAGMTYSGHSGFRISSYRPRCPIVVFSNNKKTLRVLHLGWGIRSFYYDKSISTNNTIKGVEDILKKNEYVGKGEHFVITASMPIDEQGAANTLKIQQVQ